MREFEFSIGNLKIGRDTLIFNMGSAMHCPSAALGLCGLGENGNKKCYALKTEKLRTKFVPDFRARQEKYWMTHTAIQIARDVAVILYSEPQLTTIRVNEAGDFHGPDCIEKLFFIAQGNPDHTFYTYTHRADLMKYVKIEDVPANLSINLSYKSKKQGFNTFEIVPKGSDKINCAGDCRHCHLCKTPSGTKIYVGMH